MRVRIRGTLMVRDACIVLALSLVLSVVQSIGADSEALAQSVPCTDVRVVGLRGSGEGYDAGDFGMGKLLGSVYKMILARAPATTTISAHGIPYKAVAVGWPHIETLQYSQSVRDGRDKLETYLTEIASACPDQKIVLLGYSQGAHVIGNTLANGRMPSTVTSKIAAIAFFGDPKFNSSASYARGTFEPGVNGLLSARPLSELASVAELLRSYCRGLDIVCQGLGLFHSAAEHAQDLYVSGWGASAAKWVATRLGWPEAPAVPFPGKIDVAFVIDSTGSMADDIGAAQESARSIVGTLAGAGADFRVALADYKDVDQGDPYAARIDLAFTNQADAFGSAVGSLEASGGGDGPEAVYSGVMQAIRALTWRDGAKKVIVLMGDAPAKDPEPTTGFTRASVLAAARALDPANIYGVVVGEGARADFEALAAGSDAATFDASNPSAVSAAMLEAVTSALEAPIAYLAAPTGARPGQTVSFSAAGSDDPDGSIVRYEWDFNDDGLFDLTTTGPLADHVFEAPYRGNVILRVADNDGRTATAFVLITIDSSAPTVPGAPASVTLSGGPDPRSLDVSWRPPASDGGAPVQAYGVVLRKEPDADPVGIMAADASAEGHTFTALEDGTYTAAVYAWNRAGSGPSRDSDTIRIPSTADEVTIKVVRVGGHNGYEGGGPLTTGDFTVSTGYAGRVTAVAGGGTFQGAGGGPASISLALSRVGRSHLFRGRIRIADGTVVIRSVDPPPAFVKRNASNGLIVISRLYRGTISGRHGLYLLTVSVADRA
jgi:PKD repeat protein